jgi:hypothetical protein
VKGRPERRGKGEREEGGNGVSGCEGAEREVIMVYTNLYRVWMGEYPTIPMRASHLPPLQS